MTLGDFVTECEALAESVAGRPEGSATLDAFVRSSFPGSALKEGLLRRDAARILHVFLLEVAGEKDTDWGEYAALRDVYDCRICANAIAQVCKRGILQPFRPDAFGGDAPMSEEEAREALQRMAEYIGSRG